MTTGTIISLIASGLGIVSNILSDADVRNKIDDKIEELKSKRQK